MTITEARRREILAELAATEATLLEIDFDSLSTEEEIEQVGLVLDDVAEAHERIRAQLGDCAYAAEGSPA